MDRPAIRGNQSAAQPTFVQADTANFRELVQRLTGPADQSPATPSPEAVEAPAKSVGVKKPSFKLHERRQRATKLEIKPGVHVSKAALFNLNLPMRSPTAGGFPSPPSVPRMTSVGSSISSLTISDHDRDAGVGPTQLISSEEEERAIAERRFYLHPSPRSRPGFVEPKLLTLFPLTSPRTKES